MRCLGVLAICACLLAAVATAAPAKDGDGATTTTARATPRDLPGWALYDRLCVACHGADGDGRGPAAAWLWPPPRDLTVGEWKWDAPIATIRHGVPGPDGPVMPAFGAALDDDQLAQLVDVVRAFGPRRQPAATARRTARVPTGTADAARGAVLWVEAGCATCHGADGRGEASLGDAMPYDLTTQPLRRPRADDSEIDLVIYRGIAWGIPGSAMPAYDGSLSTEELWHLVAHVETIRWKGPRGSIPGDIPRQAIERDARDSTTWGGYWPGHDAGEGALFGGTVRAQGEPPASLAPAQASLSSRQCARCHAKQVREWTGTIHNLASSPGLLAQVARLDEGGEVESCLRCHAPLAEQQPVIRPGQLHGAVPADEDDEGDYTYQPNPFYDEALRDEGLTCAACHVRDWKRHGPTTVSESLLPLPGYPTEKLAIYERSDLCMTCHQLMPRISVDGRPLLDTYREWLLGPYFAKGVQCQHCHMPNREHTWKGIHDPDTFRQGIRVEAIAARGASGVVSVRARLVGSPGTELEFAL